MPKKTHTHKYILRNIGSKVKPRKVYACSLPDCSHFMPTMALVIGKETICWQCLKKTIITTDMIRKKVKKPRCLDCRTKSKLKPEQIQEVKKLDAAVEMLLAMKGDIK
jgi:hypothetical protein